MNYNVLVHDNIKTSITLFNIGIIADLPQRVNRLRSFSTLMLTLGDIVLVRLASNIIRYRCNKNNILIF